MTLNIEQAIIDGIDSDDRVDVPVLGDVPATRPGRFISIERSGGGQADVRDLPLINVHAWDLTRSAAGDTAYAVADVLRDLAITHPSIARVSIESIYYDPDTSGQPRYRITAQAVTA
ncbi:hypothetical protein [Microbacterium sp.]|uniref:hypothetical protein n=1 Tax=Microbacterium sp. TaxID=51671 RepID=UPI003A95415E